MHASRQAKGAFRFLLETQIEGRKGRAEAECPSRQQYVLHSRVDRRTGRAGRRTTFKAWDNPDRCFMDMRCQILGRVEQPQKSLAAHPRGRFTGPITRCNLLVPGTLVIGPDRQLDLGVPDHEKPPPLHVTTAWRTDTRL